MKEERIKQLAILFAKAIKGIEDDVFDNAVLVPFNQSDRVVVVIKSNGQETVTVVNEQLDGTE